MKLKIRMTTAELVAVGGRLSRDGFTAAVRCSGAVVRYVWNLRCGCWVNV